MATMAKTVAASVTNAAQTVVDEVRYVSKRAKEIAPVLVTTRSPAYIVPVTVFAILIAVCLACSIAALVKLEVRR
jgi:hypothetical protein